MAATPNAALKFEDLDFQPHDIGNGVQARTRYPNGYGASVVQFDGSYGSEHGLYELAVLHDDGEDLRITYGTPISNDVMGWLSPEAVTYQLGRIAALPPVEKN